MNENHEVVVVVLKPCRGLLQEKLWTVFCHVLIVVVMDIVVYCMHYGKMNWGVKEMNYVEVGKQSQTVDCFNDRSGLVRFEC